MRRLDEGRQEACFAGSPAAFAPHLVHTALQRLTLSERGLTRHPEGPPPRFWSSHGISRLRRQQANRRSTMSLGSVQGHIATAAAGYPSTIAPIGVGRRNPAGPDG